MHDVEVGFDDDGRILALRDRFHRRLRRLESDRRRRGLQHRRASAPAPTRSSNFARRRRIAATNKVPNAPYRGAGRPEAAFAMERTIDLVAGTLGLEPAEVRRRNMIRADEMPYRVGIPYRDGEPIVYDSGDYPGALQKALDAVGGVEAFRERQREARDDGRYLGLGIGCYVEGTGVGPFESAMVRIDPSGKIYVSSGACPQGQGMETIFAQVVADAWSVAPEDVVMSLADTAAIAIGFGTIASRSTVTLSAAIHGASERLRDKVFAIAANLLECAPATSNCATAASASSACPVPRYRSPRWRRRRVPAGTTAARRASKPGSRRPTTASRRRSPGPMRCMSRSSRSTSSTGRVEHRAIRGRA